MKAYKSDFILKCRLSYEGDTGEEDRIRPDCETIYLHPSVYEKIFGKSLKNTDRRKRFVKITNVVSKNGVWRTFRGVPTGALSKDILYINSDGREILGGGSKEKVRLSLQKANWLSYYWNTANSTTRIAFKVGFVSCIIGFVSFLLGIASLILGIISPCE